MITPADGAQWQSRVRTAQERLDDPAWRRPHRWPRLVAFFSLGTLSVVWFVARHFAGASRRPSGNLEFWGWLWGGFTIWSFANGAGLAFATEQDVASSALIWALRALSVFQVHLMHAAFLRRKALEEVSLEKRMISDALEGSHRFGPVTPPPAVSGDRRSQSQSYEMPAYEAAQDESAWQTGSRFDRHAPDNQSRPSRRGSKLGPPGAHPLDPRRVESPPTRPRAAGYQRAPMADAEGEFAPQLDPSVVPDVVPDDHSTGRQPPGYPKIPGRRLDL